jgi:hypothetical protein
MVLEHDVTLRNDTVVMLVLLVLFFKSSLLTSVSAGYGFHPPMPQKSPATVSESSMPPLITSISYAASNQTIYQVGSHILKDCGGGDWLVADPIG